MSRRSDSRTTPKRSRCSRRCWIDTYLRRRQIARRAVGDPTIPPAFVRYGAIKNNANDQTYLRQTERLGEDFPLGSKGGIAARHYFPVDGEYVFKLRLQRTFGQRDPRPECAESVRDSRGWEARRAIHAGWRESRRPKTLVAAKAKPGEDAAKVFLYDGDEALQVRVPVKAGLHEVMATMLKTDDPEPEGGARIAFRF